MKFFFTVLVLAMPLTSWGVKWIERGNGGFALRCPNKATETFDIYEASGRHGFEIDKSHLTSVEDRVQYLISKLDIMNPSRARMYRDWYANFDKESRRVDNVEMFPVPDLGFGVKPKECTLELVVFQREPDVLSRFRYAINGDLWNQLDVLNQAAMIMHEIIYRELVAEENFGGTSESARYLNGILNSTELANLTSSEYLTLLQSLGFRNGDYGGYSILLKFADPASKYVLKLDEKGILTGAYLDHNNILFPENLGLANINCYGADSFVKFYADGSTQSLFLTYSERSGCVPTYEYSDGQSRISFRGNYWQFYPSGKIMALRGYVKSSAEPKIPFMVVKDVPFIYASVKAPDLTAKAEFDEDGILSVLTFDRYITCYESTNKRIRFILGRGDIDMSLNFDLSMFAQQIKTMTLCR